MITRRPTFRRLRHEHPTHRRALLVAAIILWNTRYLQAAFDALRTRGSAVTPELVRHVAPLGWEHIGLTGDYVWAADAQPAPGTLRPLRDRPSLLAA